MSYAQPQTIASDLLSRLELLFLEDDAPGDFAKRQLMRDAEALAKADAATASLVKAGISALAWDFEEADRWINNALRLSNSVITRDNAALTYKQLNRLDKSAEVSLATLKMAPMDTEVVNHTLSYLIWSGQLENALTLYQRALDNNIGLSAETVNPGPYLETMASLGIPQHRLIFEINAAYDVLARNNKRVRRLTAGIDIDPEDGTRSIHFGLGFNGSLNDEMRMESQLAQLFAAEPGWNPSALSVELVYISENADQFA